jgi:hypothetical protein
MRKLMHRARHVDPILVQAVIAAALSFAHIHDVAEAAGQGGWKAWAYPVSVDVLLAVAWRLMRTRGGAAAWLWFLVAMAASLGANVATSGVMDLTNPPVWLRVIVAGWPAVAFLGGTLLVHRNRAERTADEEEESSAETPQTPAEAPVNDPVNDGPAGPADGPDAAADAPILVTYAEAAEALGVAPETVRGWAAQGKVHRHQGRTPKTVLVDIRQCKSVQSSSRRLVGA